MNINVCKTWVFGVLFVKLFESGRLLGKKFDSKNASKLIVKKFERCYLIYQKYVVADLLLEN